MGLGMQMLGWDEEFCELLADRGFHVIRFDNRDVGLSSKVGESRPNVLAGAVRLRSADYDLGDMAGDAVGLLDHLEVERAHVVGASMGGMIAQTLAARHPDRVASLCSIMSGPGGRAVGDAAADERDRHAPLPPAIGARGLRLPRRRPVRADRLPRLRTTTPSACAAARCSATTAASTRPEPPTS